MGAKTGIGGTPVMGRQRWGRVAGLLRAPTDLPAVSSRGAARRREGARAPTGGRSTGWSLQPVQESAWATRNAPGTRPERSYSPLFLVEGLQGKDGLGLAASSEAATTSISENPSRPIDRPVARLPEWFFPTAMSVRLATAMYSPVRPDVIITPRVDYLPGDGAAVASAGCPLAETEGDSEGADHEKVDREDLSRGNGWPEARLIKVAPRKVSTNATNSRSTKRMYLCGSS